MNNGSNNYASSGLKTEEYELNSVVFTSEEHFSTFSLDFTACDFSYSSLNPTKNRTVFRDISIYKSIDLDLDYASKNQLN